MTRSFIGISAGHFNLTIWARKEVFVFMLLGLIPDALTLDRAVQLTLREGC